MCVVCFVCECVLCVPRFVVSILLSVASVVVLYLIVFAPCVCLVSLCESSVILVCIVVIVFSMLVLC